MSRSRQSSIRPLAYRVLLGLLLSVVGAATVAHAAEAPRIGVGVGTGRITVNEKIKPGLTYSLPPVSVFNDGTIRSDYEVVVTYNEKQPQRKPDSHWLKFSPQSFTLGPGQAQVVQVKMKTSSGAHPGPYFAYIEAHPIKKDVNGITTIKIAAATKLSFTVRVTNWWQRLLFALEDFWQQWRHIIIPALIVLAAILILLTTFLVGRKTKK
jgi:hypothetical protein